MKLTEEQKQKQKEARESKAMSSVFGKRHMERRETSIQSDPVIKQIKDQVDSMKSAQRTMIESVFLIGELLMRKKKEIGHGSFIPWINEHEGELGFSERQARNYIKVFENKETIEAKRNRGADLEELSVKQALRLIEEGEDRSIDKIKEAYSLFRKGGKISSKQKEFLRSFLEGKKESLQTKLNQLKEEIKELQ